LNQLIFLFLFVGLLAFVVPHSSQIRRVAIAFFRAFRLSLFSLLVHSRRAEWPLPSATIPQQPSLAQLFQRPPPIFSV